jgi:hypothetical protein
MAHSFLLTVVFFLMPISAVACGIGNDGRALIHICCHIILRSIDASFRVLLTLIGCQQVDENALRKEQFQRCL